MNSLRLGFVAALACTALSTRAETFTVTSVDIHDPNGLGTAIHEANLAGPGPHRIEFAIPGPGPHRINGAKQLEDITTDLEIDGTTQPGYRPNASPDGFDADLRIDLDNSNPGSTRWPTLKVVGGHLTVRGIRFVAYEGGVVVNPPIGQPASAVITGCHFVAGKLLITFSTGSRVGGSSLAERNAFGPNSGYLTAYRTEDLVVENNLFAGQLSGFPPGNAGAVFFLLRNRGARILDNTFQTLPMNAVRMFPTMTPPLVPGPTLIGNRFIRNALLAIDLDAGEVSPNDPGDLEYPVNFPILGERRLGPTGGTVRGRLEGAPDTEHTVELYSSAACDPSGFGEGEVSLGTLTVRTDALGNAPFAMPVTGDHRGEVFTALATSERGTSEFGPCLGANGALEVPTVSQVGLALLAGLVGGCGLLLIPRRRG